MQCIINNGKSNKEKNYGENGLYLLEQVDWRNNYEGNTELQKYCTK